MVRWAREYYGLDPERFVVVSRGGVATWYGELGRRYVELLDYFSPEELAAFNAERQKASGMQKQKGIPDIKLRLVARIEKDQRLGGCELLHPRLMYSGVLRYHWSQRWTIFFSYMRVMSACRSPSRAKSRPNCRMTIMPYASNRANPLLMTRPIGASCGS